MHDTLAKMVRRVEKFMNCFKLIIAYTMTLEIWALREKSLGDHEGLAVMKQSSRSQSEAVTRAIQ